MRLAHRVGFVAGVVLVLSATGPARASVIVSGISYAVADEPFLEAGVGNHFHSRALLPDLDVAAVKIGMLSSGVAIGAVAAGLDRWRARHVVLDPVMVATSGDRLLAADSVEALRTMLIPLATIITPNLPEAAALLDDLLPEGVRREPVDDGESADENDDAQHGVNERIEHKAGVEIGHGYLPLEFLRFMAATSTTSGFCAACGWSGPA